MKNEGWPGLWCGVLSVGTGLKNLYVGWRFRFEQEHFELNSLLSTSGRAASKSLRLVYRLTAQLLWSTFRSSENAGPSRARGLGRIPEPTRLG
jgi:hypothetical protein